MASDDDAIFDTIEAARITPDGKACVRKARQIAALAERREGDHALVDVEVLAECRQWLKLALEHDKATDTKLLQDIKRRLEERDERRQKLQDARAKRAAKPKPAEGADGPA
jgi:hypothetical protein